MTLVDGYKVTEVGVIPIEWEVQMIGQLFPLITDYVANGSFASLSDNVEYKRDEDYAVLIRLTDYKAKYSGPFIYVDKHSYDFLKKSSLMPKDLIIANVGAYAGYIFHAPNWQKPMTLGPNAILVRTLQNQDFCYFWFSSEIGQKSLKSIISTTAQPKFNKTDFRKLTMPVPPLPEQQKIADILSTVDDHISETESLLEKTKALKQGMMQRLLTKGIGHTEFNDTEIGRIPVEWEVVPVGSMGSTYGGLSSKNKDDFGFGYPFITYRSVFDSSIIDLTRVDYVQVSDDEHQNNAAKGDLFFTTSSETPDEVAMCSALLSDVETVYLNSFCFGYRINDPSRFDSNFARFLFRGQYFRACATKIGQGSTRYNISKNAVMKIKISLPPLHEQYQIASILTTIDDQIDDYQSKLSDLARFKTGLMQQLLTGKIRVKI